MWGSGVNIDLSKGTPVEFLTLSVKKGGQSLINKHYMGTVDISRDILPPYVVLAERRGISVALAVTLDHPPMRFLLRLRMRLTI